MTDRHDSPEFFPSASLSASFQARSLLARTGPPILLIILIIGLFYPIFMVGNSSWWDDYQIHRALAHGLADTRSLNGLPHFGYHLSVIAASQLFPDLPDWQQGRLPVLGVYVLLGLQLYALLMWNRTVIPTRRPWYVAIGAVLIMLTITAIFVRQPGFPYLIGYVNPTTYHNPTQIMLKLWVIPVSLLAWFAIVPQPRSLLRRSGYVLLAAALVVGMTFTKPNYTLALLPALAMAAAFRILRRQSVDWLLLVLGLIGPAIAVLLFQFAITFTTPDDSSVAIGFLTVLRIYIENPRTIGLLFLASTAFPVTVYLLYFERARRDSYLNWSWLVFLFGAAISYFLYEDGPRFTHNNFGWTSYITLFVLMFASLRFLLNDVLPARFRWSDLNWRLVLVFVILGLHIASAVYYWNVFTRVALE